jgi:hypothetical protein
MKKLLLVLMVVAIAAFLLVGCIPVTPGEGEGEGEGEVICPAITIAGSYTDPVSGKTYVKGDPDELTDVVVTYAQPTSGVSIYLVGGVWLALEGGVELKDKTSLFSFDLELPYTLSADGKTYTASLPKGLSSLDCETFMIKVVSCDGACECVESFTVDSEAPTAKIELCSDGCSCAGCALSFTSTTTEGCTDTVNCGDDCSGFASWTISIYDDIPFDECCDASCETPIATDSGVCPIDFTTSCLTTVIDNLDAVGDTVEGGEFVFAVVTLVDNVGNTVKWGTYVGTCDYDTCDLIWFDPYTEGAAIDDGCLDDATGVFSVCEDGLCSQP